MPTPATVEPDAATAARPWSLDFPDRAVSRVRITTPEKARLRDWEHWTWLGSDIHYDSTECDRKFYHETMREAVARNASIVMVGDLFDAMQGRHDKRSSKALRDPLIAAAYFDRMCDEWVQDHKPYANHLAYVGYGNHETAILKHNEIDLIGRSLYSLRLETGAAIQPGGYEGCVRYQFRFGNHCIGHNVYAYHGSGGGGQVTRDTIGEERLRAQLGAFRVLATGHTHDRRVDSSTLIKEVDANGRWKERRQLSVKTGTFKVSTKPGSASNWELERRIRNKAPGGYWLRWYWCPAQQSVDVEAREMTRG